MPPTPVERRREAAAEGGDPHLSSPGGARWSQLARRWGADEERLAQAVWRILCVYAATIPISIAAAQPLVVAAFVVAARRWWLTGHAIPRSPVDLPIAAFLLAHVLAACVGLDLGESLWGSRSLLLVVTIPLIALYAGTEERLLRLGQIFLAAMAFTSAATVLDELVLPWRLSEPLPGSMRESGQLVFAIALGVSLWLHRVGWHRLLPWALTLHVAALVLNMKRGAWLGAVAALVVIGALRSRRTLAATAVAIALIVAAVPSVQTRIGDTLRDLHLPGGRYDLWSAAVDVVARFPMGVGAKNGTILRDYPNVDPRHKHAHNNLLQVTLEAGVLGLAAFAWWMLAFGRISYRAWRGSDPHRPVAQALALASFSSFVGFHVAGTVEFNFGDSHVLQAALLFMAIGIAVAPESRRSRARGSGKACERFAAGDSSLASEETDLESLPLASSRRQIRVQLFGTARG